MMIKGKLKNICWSCLAFVVIGVTIVFMAGSSCKTKTDMRELVDIPVMQGEILRIHFNLRIILIVTQLVSIFQCKSL